MMARKGASPSGPAADFAARLAAAMSYKGWGVLEFAAKARVGRNSLAAHLRPKGDRLPTARMRKKYTDALGLAPLTLDQGTPQEIVAQLQVARLRVTTVDSAPFQASEGDVQGTLAFIRGQLEGFRRQGRTAVPVAQVEVWLAELEGALGTTTPPAAEAAATVSVERVESLKRAEREAAAPTQTPRGRAG